MPNSAYNDQNPLTEENVCRSAAQRSHVLLVGVMTSAYSRPLSPDDFGAQLLGGYSRERFVQREADGMNRNILICGVVFQECALEFQVGEVGGCGSKRPGPTRTRAGKNPLGEIFHHESDSSKG